jgi:hypothetical protein
MATLLRNQHAIAALERDLAVGLPAIAAVPLDAGGVTIKREARGETAEELLFVGPVHLVADICTALLDGRPVLDTTVLDIFLSVISQFRSADDIRAAFAKISAGP